MFLLFRIPGPATINFDKDKKHPARVDNEDKAALDIWH